MTQRPAWRCRTSRVRPEASPPSPWTSFQRATTDRPCAREGWASPRGFGSKPQAYSEGAYDAVYLYALAMQRAGQADKTVIPTNLQSVSGGVGSGTKINPGEWAKALTEIAAKRDVDFEGASGKVNWDQNGDPTAWSYRIWKVESGKFQTDSYKTGTSQ